MSIKDNTNYMSEKRTTKFVVSKSTHYKTFVESKSRHYKLFSLKKRTLQTFVVQESKHCQLLQSKKAHTTNLCSLKKRTLQTFVMKKRTLQTFVVLKSEHYKLCSKKAHTTNFCNKKSGHYKLFQWMAQTNICKQKSQKCAPWVLLSLCCSPLYKIPETKNRIWSLQCFCTYPSYFPTKYVA